MFLSASSTPSLREKKIWQNAQTLWPHIYTTNVEIRRLWHDIPRFFVHFLEKQIFLLKHRKCKVCLSFQLLEIETGRQSNCFSYSTSGWASDRLVGVHLHVPKRKFQKNETILHQITVPKTEHATTNISPCLASVEIAKLGYLCWNHIKWCRNCDTYITAGIDVHKNNNNKKKKKRKKKNIYIYIYIYIYISSLQSGRNVVSQLTLTYSLIAVASVLIFSVYRHSPQIVFVVWSFRFKCEPQVVRNAFFINSSVKQNVPE